MVAALAICGLPAADSAPPPRRERVASLDACPAAVRDAVRRAGQDAQLSGITRITDGEVVTWAFETGSEAAGKDREVTWHYAADGRLVLTETEIPLAEAPAPVREALLRLAGTTAVVDDVERLVAGKVVTFRAELESQGGLDRKATLAADGTTLAVEEETDD